MTAALAATSRTCWPIEQWPVEDQQLWAKTCAPQSLFEDDGGELAHLAEISRLKYAKGWGRWVAFLATHAADALNIAPAERCTKTNLQAYIDHLRGAGNSDGTIVNRLGELMAVTAALDPAFDPRLLNKYIATLRSKASHRSGQSRPCGRLPGWPHHRVPHPSPFASPQSRELRTRQEPSPPGGGIHGELLWLRDKERRAP